VVDESLDAAASELLARHPEVAGALDVRALARLAEVVADPAGESWMDPAGLLDGDSCGYPVTGGYYDVKSDLASRRARAGDVQAGGAVGR
jgi:hypothetical protein